MMIKNQGLSRAKAVFGFSRLKSAAAVAGKKGKRRNHRNGDEHPILAIKAKEREVLNQEIQRSPLPKFGQIGPFD